MDTQDDTVKAGPSTPREQSKLVLRPGWQRTVVSRRLSVVRKGRSLGRHGDLV